MKAIYAAAHARPSQALAATIVTLFFVLAFAYLLYEVFLVKLEYDQRFIYSYTPFFPVQRVVRRWKRSTRYPRNRGGLVQETKRVQFLKHRGSKVCRPTSHARDGDSDKDTPFEVNLVPQAKVGPSESSR